MRVVFADRRESLKITLAIEEHLAELKSWFPDETSCYLWGGPSLRFPHNAESFRKDILWGRITSWSGLDGSGRLAAFGQYFLQADRCHLARLAVSPKFRHRGIGSRFIDALSKLGTKDLGVDQCSLFVAAENAVATACYQKLGFIQQPWPASREQIPGVLFMVKS